MNLHPVRHLQPGDTIGIVSTSSPVTAEGVAGAKSYFEKKGYRVKIAPNVFDRLGFLSGTAETKAEDLNEMLRDPQIRMVVTAMGGAGASHLLPLIDYAAISSDPKLVTALSDPSIILNAITAKTGVPTLHGPNGIDFGYGPLTPFTEENFWPMVNGPITTPYHFPVSEEMNVLREGGKGREGGVVEGRLYGGNLRRVQALIGTPWIPDLRGAILFLEEASYALHHLDGILVHLRSAGVFDLVGGLVLGQLVGCESTAFPNPESLEEILLRISSGYAFPIVSNIRLGHTDDKITLPIGCIARLDSLSRRLELLESPIY